MPWKVLAITLKAPNGLQQPEYLKNLLLCLTVEIITGATSLSSLNFEDDPSGYFLKNHFLWLYLSFGTPSQSGANHNIFSAWSECDPIQAFEYVGETYLLCFFLFLLLSKGAILTADSQ